MSIRLGSLRPLCKSVMLWRSPSPARRPPGFIEPCLPTLGHSVPTGPQWAYEIKHDGFRFICRRDGDRLRVFSRRGNDYTDRVPRIVDTLAKLPVISVTMDGEGVACGPDGVTNFELLRVAIGRPNLREVFLYAFDLLEFHGQDLRRESRRWRSSVPLRHFWVIFEVGMPPIAAERHSFTDTSQGP
jgi:ATP-dependent DNA ligase